MRNLKPLATALLSAMLLASCSSEPAPLPASAPTEAEFTETVEVDPDIALSVSEPIAQAVTEEAADTASWRLAVEAAPALDGLDAAEKDGLLEGLAVWAARNPTAAGSDLSFPVPADEAEGYSVIALLGDAALICSLDDGAWSFFPAGDAAADLAAWSGTETAVAEPEREIGAAYVDDPASYKDLIGTDAASSLKTAWADWAEGQKPEPSHSDAQILPDTVVSTDDGVAFQIKAYMSDGSGTEALYEAASESGEWSFRLLG